MLCDEGGGVGYCFSLVNPSVYYEGLILIPPTMLLKNFKTLENVNTHYAQMYHYVSPSNEGRRIVLI
jgi:hypothetical protein